MTALITVPAMPGKFPFHRRGLALAACLCLQGPVWAQVPAASASEATAAAHAVGDEQPQLPRVVIKATADRASGYKAGASRAAAGLSLSVLETPQSVSVVQRTQIEDFGLTNINDVLGQVPGLVVEAVETDRTYYTARGFDIVNLQVDGVGVPLTYGLVTGNLDAALYEKVEVVRGAHGLLSGTGNPSAAVNFIRKRPTARFQGSVALALGSWNDQRVDADLAGPLTEDRSVRGRVVAALQDKDSYLDRYQMRKGVFGAVIEADLDAQTLLTAGYTRQENRPKAPMWGALPLVYTDGSQTDYDVSTSTAAAGSYWNTGSGTAYLELQRQLAGGWQLQLSLSQQDESGDGQMFYVYGTPDKATGEGLYVYPSSYVLDSRQRLLDLRAQGGFDWAGRRHEAIVGLSAARTQMADQSWHSESVGQPLESLSTWNGQYSPLPYTVDGGGSVFTDTQLSAYAGLRLRVSDPLTVIVGANATRLRSAGQSYGVPRTRDDARVTPYLGGVWALDAQTSAYASLTRIFMPQVEVDVHRVRLAPATGNSRELGLKREWLDKRLLTTLAVFQTTQHNLASYAGWDNDTLTSFYEGQRTRSQGVELELSGQPLPGLELNAGYTQLAIHGPDGEAARTFTPRQILRVAGTWAVPGVPGLKLGGNLGWRSAVTQSGARQAAYALLDLMASYEFNRHWSTSVQLRNVSNEKYLTSLYWTQAYYGAPRNGSVSVKYSF